NTDEWNILTFHHFMSRRAGSSSTGANENQLGANVIDTGMYIQKIKDSQETKVPKTTVELVPFLKEKISIITTNEMKFNRWPWLVDGFNIQMKIKQLIINWESDSTIKNDPILSSIIYTSSPPHWLKSGFSEKEWQEMSSTFSCTIKRSTMEGVSGYQSTDKNIKKKLHFKYLVGELMKDNHNSIVSYLYNKYGQNMDYSDVNDLEIYGILVSGFQLYIYYYVLDQPGTSINRIRLIEILMLP
ncbi:12489_t:CDS:2, partial [Entrophospora sp. SA101]